MSELRPIKPMTFPGVMPAKLQGPKPVLQWIAPSDLLVDGTYQRDLSRQSLRLIERIYAGFGWDRVKPPIVVNDAGRYHLIDGQHTAIAAASLGVPELPCFVVEAPDLAARARAFVGHNADRIKVGRIDIHHALVAAGDEDALDVDRVCKRAGVKICDFNQNFPPEGGVTKAVTVISKLVRKHGVIKARKMLECLVRAELSPIAAAAITAVEHIACVARPDVDFARLSSVIRNDGDGLGKARAKAATASVAAWQVLSARWLRRLDAGQASR